MITAETIVKNTPPQNPSQDFFGEIRSKRRWRPIIEPMQNAPVSFIQMKIRQASRVVWPFEKYNLLSNDIGKTTKIIVMKDALSWRRALRFLS